MIGDWIDEERAFGVDWPCWGRFAVVSWLVLFAAAWLSMLSAWSGRQGVSLWLSGVGLVGVAAVNGIPGTVVLLDPWMRRRFLSIAEAAAFAVLTLSAVVGLGGFAAACLLSGVQSYVVGAGIAIGIVAFPLSFGLAFPLGIPLLCSFVVWAVVNARGCISRTVFVTLASISVVGWAGVVLVGVVMGVGA